MNSEILKLVKKLSLEDKKNLLEKHLKLSEETGELAKVLLPYNNTPGTLHRFVDKQRILEESIDTILCSLSIVYDLGYKDSEIEDMMYNKSLKWMEIQAKEEKVDFPLPYETHITIKRPDNIQDFIDACNNYERLYGVRVKPIVIDLQNGGQSVMKDVMTSSKHMGDNKSAYEDSDKIKDYLINEGFDVLRVKIESVPWHPAAPTNSDKTFNMPKDCYFESHIGVVIEENQLNDLQRLSDTLGTHMSRNFFKKVENGKYVIMLTYRRTDTTYEDFLDILKNIKNILTENNYEFQKEVVEFAVYDTKINHDNEWLKELEEAV